MSVPIAVTGWIPKIRISIGVISEAPPIPVIADQQADTEPEDDDLRVDAETEDVKQRVHGTERMGRHAFALVDRLGPKSARSA